MKRLRHEEIPVTVKLTPELYQAVKKHAAGQRITLRLLVAVALEEYLKRMGDGSDAAV